MGVVGVVGAVRHAELRTEPGARDLLPMAQSPMDTAASCCGPRGTRRL